MFRMVVEEADGWNYGGLTPRQVEAKLEVLRKRCLEVGRSFEEMENSLELYVFIGRGSGEAERRLEQYRRIIPRGDRPRHFIQRLYLDTCVKGDADAVAEGLRRYIEAGVQHLILVFPGADRFEMLRELGLTVLPKVREGYG